MNVLTDDGETSAVEQNPPETNEYVAPAPYIWQPWQVEILEKNLALYRATKSVRGRTTILDKVLKKFKARTTVRDDELGNLRKVCNWPHGYLSGLNTPNRHCRNGTQGRPGFESRRNSRFGA